MEICLKFSLYQDPQYATSSGELSEIPDPEWMTRFTETIQNISYGVGEVTEQETLSYGTQEQNGYYDQQYQYYQEAGAGTDNYNPDYNSPDYNNLDYNNADYNNVDNNGAEQVEPAVHQAEEALQHQQEQETQKPESVPTFPTMFNPTNYAPDGYSQPAPPSSEVPSQAPEQWAGGRKPSVSFSRSNSIAESRSRQPSTSEPPDMGYYSQIQSKPPPVVRSPSNDSRPPEQNSLTKPASGETKSNNLSLKKPSQEPAQNKKSSWFGGIFGKILKAPNQVHLPDDSDKKIVYDDKLGRWVNLDGDEDSMAPVAPPPMDLNFMKPVATTPDCSGGGPPAPGASSAAPPAASQSFRAPKRRGRGYVDVFGQTGVTKPITAAPPMLLDSGPTSLPALPTFFNPSLAPGGSDNSPAQPEMTSPPESTGSGAGMPMMMFNPSSMSSVTDPPAF